MTISSRYIIRFDDVVETMSWSKFLPLKELLLKYKVPSLLGVVPQCMDDSLKVEPALPNYYDFLRFCIREGDSIAQHGTYHLYDSTDTGILGIHARSEFAGHSFDVQLEKLRKGKRLLESENIWMPYFMAPSHSFDIKTILALKELGFTAITDGYGFYPYAIEGLTLVPQHFSRPFSLSFGIQTICVHINSISEHRLESLTEFIKGNSNKFVSYSDVVSEGVVDSFCSRSIRKVSQMALTLIRSHRLPDVVK